MNIGNNISSNKDENLVSDLTNRIKNITIVKKLNTK